jgi:hypothetical protein
VCLHCLSVYTEKGKQIRLCSGLNYVMMRTDAQGCDEVSCYRDFVYPSSGDAVSPNMYIVQIMKAGTSASKAECSRSIINGHMIICLANAISQIAGFPLQASSFDSSTLYCGTCFLSDLLSALRTRRTLLPRNIIIFLFLILISVRG